MFYKNTLFLKIKNKKKFNYQTFLRFLFWRIETVLKNNFQTVNKYMPNTYHKKY